MPNDDPKPYLSISQLDMLSKCGEQYRRRYIEGERIPPGVSMIVGSGVDESVNANLTSKVTTETLLPTEEVAQIAADQVDNRWREGVVLSEDEMEKGLKLVKGAATDKAVRLAVLHHDDLAEKINPAGEQGIQKRWRVVLENYPRDLVGITDIVEETSVRDTKTSAKSPPKALVHESPQLTAYALNEWVESGQETYPAVALDYLIDTKTPKTATFESTRGQADFSALLRRVENAVEALEKGVFVPASQSGSWWCDKKWCGFHSTCPYVNANPVQIQV